MRGYLIIKDEKVTETAVATNAGISTGNDFWARAARRSETKGKADGLYRASFTVEHHTGFVTVGQRVRSAEAERDRLQKLADKPMQAARTSSPGIKGYAEAEHASREAQRTARNATKDLAGWLDSLVKRDEEKAEAAPQESYAERVERKRREEYATVAAARDALVPGLKVTDLTEEEARALGEKRRQSPVEVVTAEDLDVLTDEQKDASRAVLAPPAPKHRKAARIPAPKPGEPTFPGCTVVQGEPIQGKLPLDDIFSCDYCGAPATRVATCRDAETASGGFDCFDRLLCDSCEPEEEVIETRRAGEESKAGGSPWVLPVTEGTPEPDPVEADAAEERAASEEWEREKADAACPGCGANRAEGERHAPDCQDPSAATAAGIPGLTEYRYPDTADGARQYLAFVSDLRSVREARAKADPQVRGVWLLETDAWRAIVYLAGHGETPAPQHNDFEVEEREEVA